MTTVSPSITQALPTMAVGGGAFNPLKAAKFCNTFTPIPDIRSGSGVIEVVNGYIGRCDEDAARAGIEWGARMSLRGYS